MYVAENLKVAQNMASSAKVSLHGSWEDAAPRATGGRFRANYRAPPQTWPLAMPESILPGRTTLVYDDVQKFLGTKEEAKNFIRRLFEENETDYMNFKSRTWKKLLTCAIEDLMQATVKFFLVQAKLTHALFRRQVRITVVQPPAEKLIEGLDGTFGNTSDHTAAFFVVFVLSSNRRNSVYDARSGPARERNSVALDVVATMMISASISSVGVEEGR